MSKQSKNIILNSVSVDTFLSLTGTGGKAFGINPNSASLTYFPSASVRDPFPLFDMVSLEKELKAAGSSSKDISEIIGLIDNRINNQLVNTHYLNSYLLTGSTFNSAFEYAFQPTKKGNYSFNNQTTLNATTQNSSVLGASSSAWMEQYLHPSSSDVNFAFNEFNYETPGNYIISTSNIEYTSASLKDIFNNPFYSQSVEKSQIIKIAFSKTLIPSPSTASVQEYYIAIPTVYSTISTLNTISGSNIVLFASASVANMGTIVTTNLQIPKPTKSSTSNINNSQPIPYVAPTATNWANFI